MSFRFRRRIKIAPGLAINLNKGCPSLSVGGHGATLNISKRGLMGTLGAPGTGLSYRTRVVPWGHNSSRGHPSRQELTDYVSELNAEATERTQWFHQHSSKISKDEMVHHLERMIELCDQYEAVATQYPCFIVNEQLSQAFEGFRNAKKAAEQDLVELSQIIDPPAQLASMNDFSRLLDKDLGGETAAPQFGASGSDSCRNAAVPIYSERQQYNDGKSILWWWLMASLAGGSALLVAVVVFAIMASAPQQAKTSASSPAPFLTPASIPISTAAPTALASREIIRETGPIATAMGEKIAEIEQRMQRSRSKKVDAAAKENVAALVAAAKTLKIELTQEVFDRVKKDSASSYPGTDDKLWTYEDRWDYAVGEYFLRRSDDLDQRAPNP